MNPSPPCTFTPELPDLCQKPRSVKQRPTGTPLARAFLASLRVVLGFAFHLVCFALAAISGLLHPQVCHLGGVGTWFVPLCRLSLQEGLMHSDLCVDHADHTDLRCCASHAQGISLRLSHPPTPRTERPTAGSDRSPAMAAHALSQELPAAKAMAAHALSQEMPQEPA